MTCYRKRRGQRSISYLKNRLEKAVKEGKELAKLKCTFCDKPNCIDPEELRLCSMHRKAFIDGDMVSCISKEEHKLFDELRQLFQNHEGILRFECIYDDERPTGSAKRRNKWKEP